MFFRMLYDDKLAQAAYLIGCQKTGEAIVIDPERDIDRYISVAQKEQLKITAVAETHIHADFLSGSREFAHQTDVKLYLSDEGDANWKYEWLTQGNYDYQLLKNNDSFQIGNIKFDVLHTPGHTPEHICFLITDLGGGATEPMGIVSGDFVFVGDVGRPDLLETAAKEAGAKEPSARLLYQSLQTFLKLPDFLQVWPAHGSGSACGKALGAVPQSTVGYEKRFNLAILEAKNEENFVASILHGQPEPPLYFARMKKENKQGPAVLTKLPSPVLQTYEVISQLTDNAIVVDTRPWKKYSAGHISKSLHAPLDSTFPTITGSYIEPHQDIYLIVEEHRINETVRNLVRIGLDKVVGYVTPDDIENKDLVQVNSSSNYKLQENDFVLDVRKAVEYEEGHVEGSLNIAHTRLLERINEVPKDKNVIVQCRSGKRASSATSLLLNKGYKVVHIEGSYQNIHN